MSLLPASTVEHVKCIWCGAVADGTGRALSARGWRSLKMVGELRFYCPVCLGGPWGPGGIFGPGGLRFGESDNR